MKRLEKCLIEMLDIGKLTQPLEMNEVQLTDTVHFLVLTSEIFLYLYSNG